MTTSPVSREKLLAETPVGELHACLAAKLAAALLGFVTEHRLRRVYVGLGHRPFSEPDTVRLPKVSFSNLARLFGD